MIYELKATDLSGVGGPMGTETTHTKFVRFFYDLPSAKKAAEQHYGNKIKWKRGRTKLSVDSGDLAWVSYYIRPTTQGRGEIVSAEQILNVISRGAFEKWYKVDFADYISSYEGCKSKVAILEDIGRLFNVAVRAIGEIKR